MDVGRQKLRKNCDFEVSIATLSHEMDVGRLKIEEKLRLLSVARNPFARNGHWTSKTEEKLRLLSVARNPFARNGCWTSKTEEKLRLLSVARNPYHTKWTLDVKNCGKIATLKLSPAQPLRTKWTLDIKKLRKNCDFTKSIATLSHEMDVQRQKLKKNMRFYLVNRNPYARNGRWTSKIEEKLRFYLVNRNPFVRNGRWTSKTEEKLQWTLSFV